MKIFIKKLNISYKWYFGDSSKGTVDSVPCSYEFSALYPILLIIEDSYGAEGFDLTRTHIEIAKSSANFSYTFNIAENSPALFVASPSSNILTMMNKSPL